MFSRSAFASRLQIKSYFEKHKWSLQFDGTTKNGWKKKWRESDKMLFYWHRNKFSCLLSAWRSLCDNQINLDVLIKLLTCTKNIIFIRKFLGRSYFRSQFNLGDEYKVEFFLCFSFLMQVHVNSVICKVYRMNMRVFTSLSILFDLMKLWPRPTNRITQTQSDADAEIQDAHLKTQVVNSFVLKRW